MWIKEKKVSCTTSTSDSILTPFPHFTAVLAKKMKVWERRLMKDFHVAPIDVENPDEESAPEGETSLARFKRIAKKVASETTSGKWSEVIKYLNDLKNNIKTKKTRL